MYYLNPHGLFYVNLYFASTIIGIPSIILLVLVRGIYLSTP